MTREDIEAFIETLQDRGLTPNTVRMRLCAVYAFVRFLIEKKAVSYEVLERRIKLKLPDRLPRAIDPGDLKHWITTTQRYCKVSNLKVQRDYFKAMRNVLQRSSQPSS